MKTTRDKEGAGQDASMSKRGAEKRVFGLECWIFVPCIQDDPSFKCHRPQGRSLHETKDMYVDTPAPTHDASCIWIFLGFFVYCCDSALESALLYFTGADLSVSPHRVCSAKSPPMSNAHTAGNLSRGLPMSYPTPKLKRCAGNEF